VEKKLAGGGLRPFVRTLTRADQVAITACLRGALPPQRPRRDRGHSNHFHADHGDLMPIDLIVNGTRRRLEVDPQRSLLTVLREDLDLTGAKYGCGEGQCGACTVLIEGQPRAPA